MSEHRYPKRESASRGRSYAVHGLTGAAIVSASLSAVLLTDADPDAVKGACGLQPLRCPAFIHCLANAQRSAAHERNRPARAPEGMKRCACRLAAGRTAVAAGPSVGAGRTNTQRGVWYGSQGPQRSVIGRTLAVFSTRLVMTAPALMPGHQFSSGSDLGIHQPGSIGQGRARERATCPGFAARFLFAGRAA